MFISCKRSVSRSLLGGFSLCRSFASFLVAKFSAAAAASISALGCLAGLDAAIHALDIRAALLGLLISERSAAVQASNQKAQESGATAGGFSHRGRPGARNRAKPF